MDWLEHIQEISIWVVFYSSTVFDVYGTPVLIRNSSLSRKRFPTLSAFDANCIAIFWGVGCCKIVAHDRLTNSSCLTLNVSLTAARRQPFGSKRYVYKCGTTCIFVKWLHWLGQLSGSSFSKPMARHVSNDPSFSFGVGHRTPR